MQVEKCIARSAEPIPHDIEFTHVPKEFDSK
jgi:hypothetical protein